MNVKIKSKNKPINANIDILASDKSISHRACMFALFADSMCEVKYFLKAEDTLHTLKIAKSLGLEYEFKDSILLLYPPKMGLKTPNDILYCGNSGTSMRLFTGLLAGANIYSVLCGDKYLHARPMGRIVNPLNSIGANIHGRSIESKGSKDNKILAPLSIIPQKDKLQGFTYHSNISSAQVKSAMILAGLQASCKSFYSEISLSRNHTENMLLAFQKQDFITIKNNGIEIMPFNLESKPLNAFNIEIPNDPSSAFFFAILACIIPESSITLRRVLMNKTRIEAFKILEKMGADISYNNIQENYEKSADIIVKYAPLKAVEVSENISWLIDEIPALSIAMALASGISKVRNAAELRVKESDRIKVLLNGLKNFGIECVEYADGFDIIGGSLKSGIADSKGDHRIAMSFAIASCVCGGEVLDSECINTSFPNFWEILESI